jgi:hypothetical protein
MAASSDKAIITEAASRYGVRPDVLWGLYGEESSFGKNPSTSSAGAVGPFQFLPSTARSMGVNPNDFRSAAFGAAKYLSQYKGRGLGGMLSAYNAGPAGAYQPGYVKGVEGFAKSYGSSPGQMPASAPQGAPAALPQAGATEQPNPHAAGLKLLAGLVRSEKGGGALPGLLEAKAAQGTMTPGSPGVPGAPPSPPQGAGAPGGGGKLGGFLPPGAELQMNRIDQGQDIKTNPGGAIVAPGDGEVIAVKSDPSGFGPSYPVVKFTSGPMAGTSWYLGHTISALKQGDRFKAGQTLSHTGTHGVGNATVPGWAEIGLSSALGSGNMNAGQATRRYLK